MPFKIVRNDITKMNADAIVNTANTRPVVGPGCDSAIYKAAGFDELLAYRKEHIGDVPEGEAFLTPGFGLQARYIIHAVSPLFRDGSQDEETKLRSCYRNSLAIAAQKNIKSIAFPLISTGSFGYPREEGMRIAIDEIHAFLLTHDILIYLVVFGEQATMMGRKIDPELKAYIDQNYVSAREEEEYGRSDREEEEYGRSTRKGGEYKGSARKEGEFGRSDGEEKEYERSTRKEGEYEGSARKKREYGRSAGQSNRPGADYDRTGYKRLERERAECEKKPPVIASSKIGKSLAEEAAPVFSKANEPAVSSPGRQRPGKASSKKQISSDSNIEKKMSIDEEDAAYEELERKLALRMEHLSDTFQEYLFFLIGQKGLKNSDVYKSSIVDKKVFSKIKNNRDYHPQKNTALRLCIGAHLNLDEATDLLQRAGYALSPCDKTDVIFKFYIENEQYNIIDLDISLEEYGEPTIID